jgi:mRNA-degrading endonuclease toxin of MazEF toxin-antitoxin module
MLAKPSIVMCEQLRTIATEQIVSDAIAECSPELMGRVAAALVRSLAIKS